MIQLTRLNHETFFVNSDLIEHVEATPDTILALTTGARILVLEPPEEVVDLIVAFRRRLFAGPDLVRPRGGDRKEPTS
jgi:flagellar protein FlbD